MFISRGWWTVTLLSMHLWPDNSHPSRGLYTHPHILMDSNRNPWNPWNTQVFPFSLSILLHGHAHLSFPLQVCEQLNAWLGEFQFILNKMAPGNFDWSMHALLFLHTECIINAQVEKVKRTLLGLFIFLCREPHIHLYTPETCLRQKHIGIGISSLGI